MIPSDVTEIPELSFTGCLPLEQIVLPEDITSIGTYAFDLTQDIGGGNYVNINPQLVYVNVPSTVTSLGESFLGGVKANGETKLIFQVADPSIFEASSFAGISGESNPTLICPAEVQEAYQTAGVIEENDTNGYALSLEDAQLTVHGSLTITGSAWAEDARTLAMAAGMSDGTNPDGSVNREELVTMLYRYAGSPEMNVPELALIGGYPDSAAVNAWAQNTFAWAISRGVIDGRDGKLAAGEIAPAPKPPPSWQGSIY